MSSRAPHRVLRRHAEENTRHVIAKERSDCGNLNSHAIRTLYFLRRPEGPRQSRAFRAQAARNTANWLCFTFFLFTFSLLLLSPAFCILNSVLSQIGFVFQNTTCDIRNTKHETRNWLCFFKYPYV